MLNPIYCGVDTLEATFAGTLAEGMAQKLDAAKAKAQDRDVPEPFDVGGETFYVDGKGQGKYSWVLGDSRMLLRVSRSTKGMPVVSVKLRASALAAHGHEALYAQATAAACSLGDIKPNTLSRIDLACDLQGFDFTDEDFARLVCAATYRGTHKDGEGVTYQIGKRDVVMRIYRKDAELRAKNKLAYAKVWERDSDYDASAPVWRVEIQLRGTVLTELNARSVETAFTKLGRLFQFGMGWCELRVPTADKTKKRWPVDLTWTLIAQTWGASAPEPRIRKAASIESRERVVSRLVGATATLAAYSGQTDLVETMIYELALLEAHLKERGVEFSDLVAAKAARIGFQEEVGF